MIQLKFKDVTSENPNAVAACRNNGLGPETVKVYESGSSLIIYSLNDQVKHISLSNPLRKISEREIIYMIRKIMKVNPEKVTTYISNNGVYHFHYSTAN